MLLGPMLETSVNKTFRQKRFSFFLKLLKSVSSDVPIRILDIGGTEAYWKSVRFSSDNVRITLLNLSIMPVRDKNFISIKGDASDLSAFGDQYFDIVFSNSVIEHLFTKENQKRMAEEIRRVGRYYYVQTPNFYFPIEPHWLFPFFQFLPLGIKIFLNRNFNLGNYKKCKSKIEALRRIERVKLLTETEMKALFPDGIVYREYLFGLKKSITLYRFGS